MLPVRVLGVDPGRDARAADPEAVPVRRLEARAEVPRHPGEVLVHRAEDEIRVRRARGEVAQELQPRAAHLAGLELRLVAGDERHPDRLAHRRRHLDRRRGAPTRPRPPRASSGSAAPSAGWPRRASRRCSRPAAWRPARSSPGRACRAGGSCRADARHHLVLAVLDHPAGRGRPLDRGDRLAGEAREAHDRREPGRLVGRAEFRACTSMSSSSSGRACRPPPRPSPRSSRWRCRRNSARSPPRCASAPSVGIVTTPVAASIVTPAAVAASSSAKRGPRR